MTPVTAELIGPPPEAPSFREKAEKDVDLPQQSIEITKAPFFLPVQVITQKDEVFRIRVNDDEYTIEKYAELFREYLEALARGEKPEYPFASHPIWVWLINGVYIMITGYHRIAGARRAGLPKILVKVSLNAHEKNSRNDLSNIYSC